MLDVFFTVDMEIGCGRGWNNLDSRFPDLFRSYVYGTTPRGDYGLAYQLRVLNHWGMKAVFFVEPLFATRFGMQPLAEIVGLIRDAGQEVQLHLHTEWVDESGTRLLPDINHKRQYIRFFSLPEQQKLIEIGKLMLKKAGGGEINAFRAGNFGFNTDTLCALADNNILFDSSYNASMMGQSSGVMPGMIAVEPFESHGVFEYPMTVFDDGRRKLRHTQLGACSYLEIRDLLWQALEKQRKSFVILSHNFELLNQAKNRPDDIVVKRMHKLCRFLDRNRDCFRLRGFHDLKPNTVTVQPEPLRSPLWKTALRMAEQLYRRRYC